MAAANKLTDHKIKAIKATGAVQKSTDGDGLYLPITPIGAKLWRMGLRMLISWLAMPRRTDTPRTFTVLTETAAAAMAMLGPLSAVPWRLV